MNIKILDSWLKEYLKTEATPQQIAEKMSLTSVSIERIEKLKQDYIYDIEITTNRPDLMSVVGLAREAATVLSQHGIPATYIPLTFTSSGAKRSREGDSSLPAGRQGRQVRDPDKIGARTIIIENDPKLVNRVCAVIMEVQVKDSPTMIKDRLESSDIRSLNNLIDITNYVMRTIGHPAHVFDFDRLQSKKLTIRESKKGEIITTLDGKSYELPGGDIIAVNDKGEIVDLLGIMGLENSVVIDQTKRILFFIDNNDPMRMRKTSMQLAIRSEAVQMNEKRIDPEIAMDALLFGISLYKELADGKILSEIIDIYPKPYKAKTVSVDEKQIQTVIGVPISLKQSADILQNLGFKTTIKNRGLEAVVPSFRAQDVTIPEDLIEEIARIYGYHMIPSALPPLEAGAVAHAVDTFYWEQRIKDALKYWGFTEVYTYSLVPENLFEGEMTNAVTIQNPLNEDMVYMRRSLVPSLLQVLAENKTREQIKIFELSSVYEKRPHDLPNETLHLAGVIKKPKVSFFEIKGLLEQLIKDLGIHTVMFKPIETGSAGAEVYIQTSSHPVDVGNIEILEDDVIDFEINFSMLAKHATLKKTYTPLAKYPPIIEDMAFIVPDNISVGEIQTLIEKQSALIKTVQLFDKYKDSRAFRITYQDPKKNLTTEDIAPIREKIIKTLKEKLSITTK